MRQQLGGASCGGGRWFLVMMVIAGAGLNAASVADEARGVVFEDHDRDGLRDPGEDGIAGVGVSNGREIVMTDANGRYQLPVDHDTLLFVIKPRNWMTPTTSEGLPRFYYNHKPDGSPQLAYAGVAPTGPLPESVDFGLFRRPEGERFRIVLFGDPQPRDRKEIDYIAQDIVSELVGVEAAFGVSVGDLVYDDLSLFEPLVGVTGQVGIPWYNVLGNHDMNFDAPNDRLSDESFERVYGPPYYSFNHGPVHFVVLDDVHWPEPVEGEKRNYSAGLGRQQLEFLRNDLKHVDHDQRVVLMFHIPIQDLREKDELFALLKPFKNVLLLAGHYHFHKHMFFGPEDGWHGENPLHQLIAVTACGSWWTGAPDEMGIPHTTMRDGAPNGYSFIDFDGSDYVITFKAARRPASHQMLIDAPPEVEAVIAHRHEVYVNVFNGSERSTVEMRLGDKGEWRKMDKYDREDPYYLLAKQAEASQQPPRGRKLPGAIKSPHMWHAMLPKDPEKGWQLLHVRTTDMHGRTYTDQRVIRVK